MNNVTKPFSEFKTINVVISSAGFCAVESRAFIDGEPVVGLDGVGEPYHLGQISSSYAWATHDMEKRFKDRWERICPHGYELRFEADREEMDKHEKIRKSLESAAPYMKAAPLNVCGKCTEIVVMYFNDRFDAVGCCKCHEPESTWEKCK